MLNAECKMMNVGEALRRIAIIQHSTFHIHNSIKWVTSSHTKKYRNVPF